MAAPGVRAGAALGCLLSVGLLAGCGSASSDPGDRTVSLVGDRVLPVGGTAYDEIQVTWAQGGTIHYGEQDLDTGAVSIRAMAAASSGWFLEVADGPSLEESSRWEFFDGRELHPLPGVARFVSTSADGRYAGWVDYDGPVRPGGQVARVVVVDLGSGRVVLDDSSGMGGETARDGYDTSDLYAELPPTFLGFDGTHAYWQTPGDRLRWSEETGVERAQREVEGYPGPFPVGRPTGRYSGTSVSVTDGRVDPGSLTGTIAVLSPDRDVVVETGVLGRAPFTDARTGRRLRVDLGHRFADFGAWVGPDRVALRATERRLVGVDVSGEDPSRGFLTVCDLDSGACLDERPLVGLFSVVFPDQVRDFSL